MRAARESIGLIVVILAMSLTAAGAQAASNTYSFKSDPTVEPPRIKVTHRAGRVAPGLIIVGNFDFQSVAQQKPPSGQSGPLIIDNSGQPVWFRAIPQNRYALNTRVQTLAGKPVLTWWQGGISPVGVPSNGVYYLVGSDYRPVKGYAKRITGQDGWTLSMHEFLITARGTALVTAYKPVGGQDLSPYGGFPNSSVLDSGVLEYDLKTGKLVYTWSALEHIPLAQSKTKPFGQAPWDAYHINSIDADGAGHLLVSMRNTWGIYDVVQAGGAIAWTLGGDASFTFGPNAPFAFQHDARYRGAGQISMFDNGCCAFRPDGTGAPPVYPTGTRGLVLNVDPAAHTASLARQYTSKGRVSPTQGDTQLLPNGNVLLGWGQSPFISEYSRAGNLLFEAKFPGTSISYRALRSKWTGKPATRPHLAVRRVRSKTRLYVSWNGATQVVAYRISGGPKASQLATVARRVRRSGFETVTTVAARGPLFQVRALDARGRVLGTSQVVRTGQRDRFTPNY